MCICICFTGQFIALSWETYIDAGNCAAVLPTGKNVGITGSDLAILS